MELHTLLGQFITMWSIQDLDFSTSMTIFMLEKLKRVAGNPIAPAYYHVIKLRKFGQVTVGVLRQDRFIEPG